MYTALVPTVFNVYCYASYVIIGNICWQGISSAIYLHIWYRRSDWWLIVWILQGIQHIRTPACLQTLMCLLSVCFAANSQTQQEWGLGFRYFFNLRCCTYFDIFSPSFHLLPADFQSRKHTGWLLVLIMVTSLAAVSTSALCLLVTLFGLLHQAYFVIIHLQSYLLSLQPLLVLLYFVHGNGLVTSPRWVWHSSCVSGIVSLLQVVCFCLDCFLNTLSLISQ